jgi:hypothetical protein
MIHKIQEAKLKIIFILKKFLGLIACNRRIVFKKNNPETCNNMLGINLYFLKKIFREA